MTICILNEYLKDVAIEIVTPLIHISNSYEVFTFCTWCVPRKDVISPTNIFDNPGKGPEIGRKKIKQSPNVKKLLLHQGRQVTHSKQAKYEDKPNFPFYLQEHLLSHTIPTPH